MYTSHIAPHEKSLKKKKLQDSSSAAHAGRTNRYAGRSKRHAARTTRTQLALSATQHALRGTQRALTGTRPRESAYVRTYSKAVLRRCYESGYLRTY